MEAALASAVCDAAAAPAAGSDVFKVNEQLSTSGHLSPADVATLQAQGFRSLVNLRESSEDGFEDLAEAAQAARLSFFHCPFSDKSDLSNERLDAVLSTLDLAPKPVMVVCRSNRRAKALGVAHDALRREAGAQEAVVGNASLAAACDRSPGMQQFLHGYVESKIARAAKLPEPSQVAEGVWVSGQFTEALLARLQADKGIKSVLNLRKAEEQGRLGLGVLPREAEICKGLGLQYASCPMAWPVSAEEVTTMSAALSALPRPVLVKCLAGKRAEVASKLALADAHVTTFFEPDTGTACHVVVDLATLECAIIDPVLGFNLNTGRTDTSFIENVLAFVRDQGLTLKYVLETHVHADHVSAADVVAGRFPEATTGIGEQVTAVQATFRALFNLEDLATDGSQFQRLFADGDTFRLGGLEGRVLHTPGHTPACVTYVIGQSAFCGDTIFMPDMGTARCDFPGGSASDLYDSVQKLFALPDSHRLFVGHDYAPGGRPVAWETTIGEQKASNKSLSAATSKADFIAWRRQRDAQLGLPRLMIPSVQANLRSGALPPPEANGTSYFKVPINTL